MFGHRFFGSRYFAPRYFGDGGNAAPPAATGYSTMMLMGIGRA